jgi:hypothetical protein
MHFAKGTKGGRKHGVPNKFTRVMREAAILAAEDAKQANGQGLYGYLLWCAENIPHVYLRSVLSKLIPMRVDLNAQMRHWQGQSAEEIRAELRARGVPIPDHLFPIPKVPTITQRPLPEPAKPRDEDNLQIEEPEPPSEPPYTWSPAHSTPLRVFDFGTAGAKALARSFQGLSAHGVLHQARASEPDRALCLSVAIGLA